ncbi:TonB-dependent receptor [Niabella terrae]
MFSRILCYFIFLLLGGAPVYGRVSPGPNVNPEVYKGRLSGLITDAATGHPLEGATISLPDLKITSVSGRDGRYHINSLPQTELTLQVSYVGYKSVVTRIRINNETELDFQLQASIVETETVTVTGVSTATSLKRSPQQVSVISAAELQQSTGTTLLDMVAREPGVSIVTTGPAVAKPFIRGLGYNRVLAVHDGVRQEGQQWGDEHGLEVDEYSTRRIEILRGPASLIYGSDAIGGVINILTYTPVPLNSMQGTASASFNSNNRMYGTHLRLGSNHNGWNWNLYGSLKSAADYQNKYDGQVLNSRFREKNFGGALGVNKSWGYSHLLVSSFHQEPGMVEGERDDQGRLVLDGYPPSDQQRSDRKPLVPYQSVNHLTVTSDNAFSLQNGHRLTALLAFQQNRRKEFGEVDAPSEPEAYFELRTLDYNLGYHLHSPSGFQGSLGFSGMYQQNRNRAEEALIPDYGLLDLGLYLVASKNWQQTTLSGGLRFDHRDYDSQSMEEAAGPRFDPLHKKFSNISGSIGLSHAVNDILLLKLGVSRGFRAPNASELSANGEHEGTGRYEIGNNGLRSEIATAVDGSMDITTQHLDISVAPYFNHISHFIFYNKLLNESGTDSLIDGAVVYQFNQQSARLYGLEARIDLHPHPLDWLHFENTFSWVRGRFTEAVDGSRNLPLIAPASLRTELRAELPHTGKHIRNLHLRAELQTVADQDRYFSGYATETATKGYMLLNSGAGADIKIGPQQIISLELALNNITDQAYQSHLSRLKYTDTNPVTGRVGVFNMGRNFTARIIVPFGWQFKDQ